ncbi:MAG TPA: hypothetical protein VJ719_08060 [Chthoniobacterales bacterium]|nr:hypothetical protein [Chthoniobacterales bacterium]
MWNPSINIEDLRTLLEDLYPDVHISSRGVTLLAAQIRNLENERDLVRKLSAFAATTRQVDQPGRDPVIMASTIHSEE